MDPILLSNNQSALAKVLTGKESSLAPLVHKKAAPFRNVVVKRMHLPITAASDNTSQSVAIPRYGLVSQVFLRITVQAPAGLANPGDQALADGWAYSLFDSVTISSHGKVISTVPALAAFEYANRVGDNEGKASGWAHVDGTSDTGSTDLKASKFVTAILPLPFGLMAQLGDCIDTTFLEALDLTISWNQGFSAAVQDNLAQSVKPADSPDITIVTSASNRDSLGVNIPGTGFEITYFQMGAQDMQELSTMKYASPDSTMPKSNLYMNYFAESRVTVAPSAENTIEVELPIHCKSNIVKSYIFLRQEGGDDATAYGKLHQIDNVELFCNGTRYWSMDNRLAYTQQLMLKNSLAVHAPVAADNKIMRICYNLQDNPSRQNSGMASFRNVSSPCYKIKFNNAGTSVTAALKFRVYVVHEVLTITSFDASNGQIQNALSL